MIVPWEDRLMQTKLVLEYVMIAEVIFAWGLLAILVYKKLARSFSCVTAYLVAWGLDLTARTALLYFHRQLGLSPQSTFNIYFYSCWTFVFVEHALILCIIFQVFRRAMLPFKGLRRLGTMVFQWVCVVAVIVTLAIMVVPGHLTVERYLTIGSQFEQGISILTVCLLLFVCFSIRYLGMTYRSHVFGVSLGLGIWGAKGLVESAWYSTHGQPPLYSINYLVQATVGIATLLVWGAYFILPEPKRKMVLLPTTSPYFHWNQISEALGDDPGVVAVAGFTPEALSPAERLVLGTSSTRETAAQKSHLSARKSNPSVRVRVSAEHAVAAGAQR
jgi:hypothetical protein